jgi:hypothetical protein
MIIHADVVHNAKMKTAITITILVLMFMPAANGQVDKASIRLNDTIQLDLYRIKFDSTGKHFEYYESIYPFSINGIPLLGTDGEYPKFQLSKAILTIGRHKYNLQVDNMYNPWFGEKPFDKLFRLKIDGTQIRVRAVFSDGAGSYGVEWLIVGLSSVRSIYSNDEKIMKEYILND